MAKFDLKSASNHVPVHLDDRWLMGMVRSRVEKLQVVLQVGSASLGWTPVSHL